MQEITMQAYVILLLACAYLAYEDYTEYRLSNKITVPLLLAGLVYHLYTGNFKNALAGMLFCGGIFLIGALKGGIGGGDVKFSAAIGAWLGYPAGPWVIATGAVMAVIYGLFKDPKAVAWIKLVTLTFFLKFTGSKINVPTRNINQTKDYKIPFGTFLALGVFGWALVFLPLFRLPVIAGILTGLVLTPRQINPASH